MYRITQRVHYGPKADGNGTTVGRLGEYDTYGLGLSAFNMFERCNPEYTLTVPNLLIWMDWSNQLLHTVVLEPVKLSEKSK